MRKVNRKVKYFLKNKNYLIKLVFLKKISLSIGLIFTPIFDANRVDLRY